MSLGGTTTADSLGSHLDTVHATVAPTSEHQGNAPSPRKRQRRFKDQGKSSSTPTVRRGRRGKLELMPTMNLDVLYHILSFLLPMDLLNLARTTKDFRLLLMHKSSSFIWKTSRLQLESLPDCPPDLSEPQFANLAFYPHCHSSAYSHVALSCEVLRSMQENTIGKCMRSSARFDKSDWPAFAFTKLPTFSGTTYHQPEVEGLRSSIESLPPSEITAYVEQRWQVASTVEQHARECEDWFQSVSISRKNDLRNAREELERGWEPELNYFGWDMIAHLSAIREPKPLTARVLANISAPLTTWMTDWRDLRIERTVYSTRRRILMDEYRRFHMQPFTLDEFCDIMPHVADVSNFQPFDDVIRLPADVTVTAESFNAAFAQLPILVSAWRRRIEAELVEHCLPPRPSAIGNITADHLTPASRLRLASTVFVRTDEYSRHCATMVYPDVLADKCFNRLPETPDLPDAVYEMHETLNGTPWSVKMDDGVPSIKLFEPAADIIRACGMNPDTATVSDMNLLDARVKCVPCSMKGGYSAMTWHAAIDHAANCHHSDTKGAKPLQFARIDSAPCSTMILKEEESLPAEHCGRLFYLGRFDGVFL
ncbi:hypothetical protein SERLA73DRAFT_74313 [Serpula lacrymans var. lacrymans S7.3]|uniref:F-box domain-containing protein n=1 Tax=Serpula lacrymans var. lacrymans (strain S7.3) TaxID=936435 RepID=F8Q181_SERL3|nr:hypothetical protein SERLA73DRAFT_74313 [Serpula lacrymans var. lacrymans S7.3]